MSKSRRQLLLQPAAGFEFEKESGDWIRLELFLARVPDWPCNLTQSAQSLAAEFDANLKP
jgi:hypothetical protein